MAKNVLAGSERRPMAGAKSVGKADPAEQLEVTVLLRRGNADALRGRVGKLAGPGGGGATLSREEFERQFGAAADDIAAVRTFAADHGLSVVEEHAGRRTVVLSGAVAKFNAAFGVDLQRFEGPDGSYRGRVGSVQLPDELRDRVEAVLGLDNRPAAKPHFRVRRAPRARRRPAVVGASFTPLADRFAVQFPAGRRAGGMRGDHRARRRRAAGGFEDLFLVARRQLAAEGHRRFGGSREEQADRRSGRS